MSLGRKGRQRCYTCEVVALKSTLILKPRNALIILVVFQPNSTIIGRAIVIYREGLQSAPPVSGRPKLLNKSAGFLLHRSNNRAELFLDDHRREASTMVAEAILFSEDETSIELPSLTRTPRYCKAYMPANLHWKSLTKAFITILS